jgi:hypothetical protein
MEVLDTCHPKIQIIMKEVIKGLNISAISGHRGELEQNVLFHEKRSKLRYPLSKHNSKPSTAIDIMLWNKSEPHIRWNDSMQMNFVAGYVTAVARRLGIKLRCGADWNGNHIDDESFYDGAHYELDKSEL